MILGVAVSGGESAGPAGGRADASYNRLKREVSIVAATSTS